MSALRGYPLVTVTLQWHGRTAHQIVTALYCIAPSFRSYVQQGQRTLLEDMLICGYVIGARRREAGCNKGDRLQSGCE